MSKPQNYHTSQSGNTNVWMNKLISHLEAVSLENWSHIRRVRIHERTYLGASIRHSCMARSGTAHNAAHTHFTHATTTQHLGFCEPAFLSLGLSNHSTTNQHSVHDRALSNDSQISIMTSHLHDMITLTWCLYELLCLSLDPLHLQHLVCGLTSKGFIIEACSQQAGVVPL